MGDILSGRIDVAVGQFFYIPQREHLLSYVYPYDQDAMCFLIPKEKPLSKWSGLLRPYQPTAAIAMSASWFLGLTAIYVLGRASEGDILSIRQVIFFGVGMVLSQGQRINIR